MVHRFYDYSPIVGTSQMKEHLNIVNDDEIEMLLEINIAAQDHLERLLGYKLVEEFPDGDGLSYPETVPPALKRALLLILAHWYENREATIIGTIVADTPIGVWDIVNEYRKWGLVDGD